MTEEFNPHDRAYTSWTRTAEDCKDSNQDCKKCPIHTVYGFHPDYDSFKKCWIPEAIRILEQKEVPRPVRYATAKFIQCPQCEKLFVPKRKTVIYCSISCGNRGKGHQRKRGQALMGKL